MEAFTGERLATIEALTPLMRDAIGHAIWRAAQLLAAMGLVLVLLVGVVVFTLRRDRPSASA